jgi:hypothetical protein
MMQSCDGAPVAETGSNNCFWAVIGTAPETDQVCLDAHAAKWECGTVARDRLIKQIDGRPIECKPTGSVTVDDACGSRKGITGKSVAGEH